MGDRRTELGAAPVAVDVASEAFVEREAITVILSDKGWIRAVRGVVADPAELQFKEGDKLKRLLPCHTTDRLTLFATNGRAYTLKAGDLPRGRGDGQPVRLLAELTNEDDVVALFVAARGREVPGGVHHRPRLRRAGRGACGGKAHRQADAESASRARRPRSACSRKAITSRWSARTASCWCSRWTRCRKWRAAPA